MTALRAVMGAVAVVALVAGLLGLGVRSTFGGRAAVDEPQYLLTALSLAEDGNLDLADELRDRRWTAFHDTRLPTQTRRLDDGRELSPHDPLLPVLLAAPMGLGGWRAAKVTMALLAAVLAALLVWTAVRRFAVPLPVAGIGTALAAASPPIAVYASQVYPEVPAALATTIAVAALTGAPRRTTVAVTVAAVVALPWLSVKYVPVAAALAVVAGARWWRAGARRPVGVAALTLGLAGIAYLAVHRLVWGGWTVYASGDHFVDSGEFGVVGFAPDYLGRTIRLAALLTDRGFGLVAWQPAALLLVGALAWLLVRRPAGTAAVTIPLAAGWATATWIALTMHGYWWPGRQLVVVLPLALLAILLWLTHAGRRLRLLAAGLGALGVLAFGWLLADGWVTRVTWVSRFEETGNPVYRALHAVLPDYRHLDPAEWVKHGIWLTVLAGIAGYGWWSARAR